MAKKMSWEKAMNKINHQRKNPKKYNKAASTYNNDRGYNNIKPPYNFKKRKKKGKEKPTQFHNVLLEDHYDIAFEIKWETLTETAANPVVNSDEPATCPKNNNSEFQAYNKRWLTIDGKLAISPFTVKSAIANGFANILGGCYRVNTKKGSHSDIGQGKYPYGGKYKRYRVDRANSHPGIVTKIEKHGSGDKTFTIQPVNEFLYDKPDLPIKINNHEEVYVKAQNRGRKPKQVIDISDSKESPVYEKAFYYGEYRFGMDLRLNPGEIGKNHYHRFYTKKGAPIEITVPAINFKSKDELKSQVYLGSFDKTITQNPPNNYVDGQEWHENLDNIVDKSFVYYQRYADGSGNIGQNFQFKALFLHEDTIPPGQETCSDLDKLCPRCRMFGMVTDKNDKVKKVKGFKGRFKSSTLINNQVIKEGEPQQPPKYDFMDEKIELKRWHNEKGERIARQVLLPILGEPKPNKRDKNGYFDKDSGELKGAKYYQHAKLNLDNLINETNRKNTNVYSHKLRNYAQVCEAGLAFTGTVGAENCNLDEIGALLVLLHSKLLNNGFKIGLGKSLGLGSIKSTINKIWIRKQESYDSWKQITINSTQDIMNNLKNDLPGVDTVIKNLKSTAKMLNSLQIKNDDLAVPDYTLEYPGPDPRELQNYWRTFNNNKVE